MYGDEDTGALLTRLSRAWEASNKAKAAGGAYALSGFSFQFSLALLEVVERWRKLPGDRRAVQSVFVELLSDVAKAYLDGRIAVTQVKRTQSSSAIRKGLEDLQSVYEVAAVELPTQLSRIEFELAFRTGRPEKAWPVIEAWAQEDPDARAGLAETVSVNLYPDPESRIYALLVNDLKAAKPVALFHRWLGELMTAAGQRTPEERRARLEVAAEQIWASLIELSANHHVGAYLWSPVDRLPDQVREGGVLTGQQPSVAHLRKGYLAARPDALARIRMRFQRWLAERSRAQVQTTVPLFWIGGRSGSGKSALLLQFLSSLREEGTGPVLSLSDKSSSLAEVARWSREAFESERPPIIGLDDPYAPDGPRDQIWGSFLAELTSGLQAGEGEGVPILVCAGPNEQAEAFKRDFRSDFDIEVVKLEREQPEELMRLKEWYEQRTGAPAPGPDDENVLLVQLFFEWREGIRLHEFAQRFRRRLVDADPDAGEDSLVTVLTEVLALNRLYVGYPSRGIRKRIKGARADVLKILEDEEHIAIDEEGGRSGAWVAHPHLANEIYEAWFPRRASANQRRSHFVDAGLACMRDAKRTTEKVAPIRAVAQALGPEGHLLGDRVDSEFVAALPELYDAARGVGPEMQIEELGLWIEVQNLAGASFDPDPVEEVLPRIGPDLRENPGATRLCETLLSSFDHLTESQRKRLPGAIMGLLAKTPTWTNWPRVAAASMKTGVMPQLADLVDEWLESRLWLYSSGWPLLAALEEYRDDPRFEAHALRLLREHSGHSAWGRTWMALWQRRPSQELVELGTRWLRANGSDRSWTFVWRALAQVESSPEMVKMGGEWIERNPEHPGWTVVWDSLWGAQPSARLEQLALGWLDSADVNKEGFGIVWCHLWDSNLREDAFREQGEAALRRMSTDIRSWEQMLSRLLKDGPSDEFWQVGLNWVETAGIEDRSWGWMLPSLLEAAYSRKDEAAFEDLLRKAYGFLREADSGHPGWSHVFGAVWESSNEELRSLGQGWIGSVEDRKGSWGYVWERLWEDEPSELLVDHALPWLQENIGTRCWSNVWTCLCREGSGASRSFDLEGLLDLGEIWLDATPADDPGWTYVFIALWKQRPRESVRRLGFEWLAERKESYQPVWDRVWTSFWDDPANRVGEVGATLRQLGIEWLEWSQDHEHWANVWCPLWDGRQDARLRELGDRWTRNGGAFNPRRRSVIIRLTAPQPDLSEQEEPPSRRAVVQPDQLRHDTLRREISRHRTEEAMAKGLDVVRAGPSSGREEDQLAWKRLWVALWRLRPSSELRQIAIDWLRAPASTDSRGRSTVWELLWRAEPSADLYEIGCDYLATAPLGRLKWTDIWHELWQYEASSSLHRLAFSWLDVRFDKAVAEGQSQWPGVWRRVFEERPTPELAALARRWLQEAPDLPDVAAVRRLLSDTAAPY